ncbi:DNA (cytosine-5-)-methyltransferase [Halobacillus aidingensis]|uniref:Cytosine-specific methyltransferase n=1 Tax=Halobacillus aidingensis TaxID=240303 RepID=A0A1H0M1N4_HALAD|nr:DNA (cytosine-5-)-methyltransferase [Halobacillus aidingensis]SDO74368.1 DNA (cytosine-5)-methyltransferase 1 [Halobacillus aidingensis]
MDVVELFAGVGGFRIGLEKASHEFNTVWANQWEPSTKSQPAFECYTNRFHTGEHSNEDIAEVWPQVPEHDLLVGGFPCQDYSVARTLSGESGIQGKKGVLFWQIMNIVQSRKPKYLLLENVDRLLKSPSKQRGRDFSVMLASLRDEGYYVEWRVINAADYGFAQRRRRVFIFAFHKSTLIAQRLQNEGPEDILHSKGFFVKQFPVKEEHNHRHPDQEAILPTDIVEVSDHFSLPYKNSGILIGSDVYSAELIPDSDVSPVTLREILEEANAIQGEVDEKYYLKEDNENKKGRSDFEEMKYQKGAKREKRVSQTGHEYYYTEGGMAFPENLDAPSRTMLTSEGTKNRSSHVVEDLNTGRIRFITPLEAELLNGFPPDWTKGFMPERTRYFCMGNALVTGIIEKIGHEILKLHKEEEAEDHVSQLDLFETGVDR